MSLFDEQKDDYLQCKICYKQFPKYDQRGFRNAGFTAHQNRCIERKKPNYLTMIEQQHSKPKHRLLLPAPEKQQQHSSSLTTPNYMPYSILSTQQRLLLPEIQTQAKQINTNTNSIESYLYNNQKDDNTTSPSTLLMDPMMMTLLQSELPIFQCDYCTPDEYGFHQLHCIAFIPSTTH
ncbi:uncharacterized protein BX663DRAFT_527167 [Cokeromyces recurvatus]|uniref:uncharacterized protein n=1 Tax=Cokeromyces recurvatus TaxID=90255 RepID=UPI00221F5BED|nr:uncharacterized protein BX663DRAFT_527167 [Cokeromyces recurvatus]KAI7897776.1 hypothetical protein BX663DRAFT_527167 [Cokeromyces recurvatus]